MIILNQESREAGKFAAEDARLVAQTLVANLKDSCYKIEVAGSLRRRKAEVGDIEIVFVPLIRWQEGEDFFAPIPMNRVEEAISQLLHTGMIKKRLNVNGKESWGMMNKLAVHSESGIPVDLFTANKENFYNYLVCRTGPSESNIRICEAAIAKGWQWNPYGKGFSRNGDAHVCSTEREVFEFVGLEYMEPWKR